MRTILYDEHVKMNANIVDFHGWDMPLYYESIIKEHMYVRERCGVFDVSHMGDMFLTGSGAEESLMKLFPSDISKMKEGDCLYTAFLNNDGNMIDDTIIYKFNKEKFLCVPNAATTDKILDHILKNKTNNCEVKNSSSELSCIAIQGKDSINIIKNLGLKFPDFFKFYEENGMIISGTGYTGEIGCEIIIKNNEAVNLWEKIVDDLKKIGCGPCGLGSRDTLRMEKGMLLSGQDFNSDKNPYEASISFILDNDHNYIGREKLLSNQKPERIFRGIIMNEKGSFPRHGNLIYDKSGKEIGIITSGSISPILGKGIGLGYINRNESKIDTSILVGIRDKKFNGKVSRPRIVP